MWTNFEEVNIFEIRVFFETWTYYEIMNKYGNTNSFIKSWINLEKNNISWNVSTFLKSYFFIWEQFLKPRIFWKYVNKNFKGTFYSVYTKRTTHSIQGVYSPRLHHTSTIKIHSTSWSHNQNGCFRSNYRGQQQHCPMWLQ